MKQMHYHQSKYDVCALSKFTVSTAGSSELHTRFSFLFFLSNMQFTFRAGSIPDFQSRQGRRTDSKRRQRDDARSWGGYMYVKSSEGEFASKDEARPTLRTGDALWPKLMAQCTDGRAKCLPRDILASHSPRAMAAHIRRWFFLKRQLRDRAALS